MFEKPVVKTFQYGNHTVTLELALSHVKLQQQLWLQWTIQQYSFQLLVKKKQ